MGVTMQRYTITGPETAHRAGSAEALILKHAAHMQSMGLPVRGHTGPPPRVYVSEGRAVLDCECGNGPQASRAWGLAVCFACGLVYTRLAFPLGWSDIDLLMSVRPRRRQNLQIGESLGALSEENLAHGLPHDPEAIRSARQAAVGPAAVMRMGGKAVRGL